MLIATEQLFLLLLVLESTQQQTALEVAWRKYECMQGYLREGIKKEK